MIKRDYHVHLHGCLTPFDLWDLGKESFSKRLDRLEWYAREYEKAWGRRPAYRDYWQCDDGLERLSRDYLFLDAQPFTRFQANFNLILALCPLTPHDWAVQERIIRRVACQGLEYFEARTLIPATFTAPDAAAYLTGLCRLVERLNAELGMETKLVFCLFRDNTLAVQHHQWLCDFRRAKPELAAVIAGFDFAYAEEGSPPKTKRAFYQSCDQREAGLKGQRWLRLYHVGESFRSMTQASAIRWVMEAWQLGVDRLGHATALGMNPRNHIGRQVQEPLEEYRDHLSWLLAHATELAFHGYPVDQFAVRRSLLDVQSQSMAPVVTYDDVYASDTVLLQQAVASMLAERGATIESCPSSNKRIGEIRRDADHPLCFFKATNLKVVLGTDDPGIFGVDWGSEAAYAARLQQLS